MSDHATRQTPPPASAAGTAVDPVCGMTVAIATAEHRHEHAGRTFYFCAERCRSRFAAEPARYLDAEAKRRADEATASARPAGTEYTCPMHPEVVQVGPGNCPKCGMALEPKGIPPIEAGPDPEYVDFLARLKLGAALTLPLVVIAMAPHVGVPLHRWVPPRVTQWLELALAVPVVLWCGLPFIERGIASIRHRSPNMWTLIAMGVSAAFLYSIVAVLAPGIFPAELRGHGGTVGVYFEAAAVIIVLVLAGQLIELRARAGTGQALRDLIGLAPQVAHRVAADGSEADVPLAEVMPGERLAVRPGEAVPVDGVVIDGRTSRSRRQMK